MCTTTARCIASEMNSNDKWMNIKRWDEMNERGGGGSTLQLKNECKMNGLNVGKRKR